MKLVISLLEVGKFRNMSVEEEWQKDRINTEPLLTGLGQGDIQIMPMHQKQQQLTRRYSLAIASKKPKHSPEGIQLRVFV